MKRNIKSGLCSVLSAAMIIGMLPVQVNAAEYRDNTYRGTGKGLKGDITLDVTIKDGKITEIKEVSQSETPSYWEKAKSLLDTILEKQTTEVDAVSGATRSSNGIKEAVNSALAQAEITEENKIFAGGAGTKENPFEIATEQQLRDFAASVDQGNTYAKQYVTLANDITLSETSFEPIGESDNCFAGTFDGNSHAISNLTIGNEALDGGKTQAGLFDTLAALAVVENVHLKNANISVSGSGVIRAGGITGDMKSGTADEHPLITNCTVEGKVSADTSGTALCFAGGIAGRIQVNGYVTNCGTDADISAVSNGGKPSAYAGGIAGQTGNKCVIANAYALGDISAKAPESDLFGGMAGGIVAMHASKIYNVYATGNVTIENADIAHKWVGGIAGDYTANVKENDAVYGYYNSESVQTINGEKLSELQAVGVPGSSLPVGVYSKYEALSKAEMQNAAFAEKLNGNIANAKSLAELSDITWNAWYYDSADQTVKLTSEAYQVPVTDQDIFESGNGTKENPYVIANATQLRAFAASLSDEKDYSNQNVVLSADIDVSGSEWTPIGGSDYAFCGTFDGQGHSIIGIRIGSATEAKEASQNEMYFGLFGCLDSNAVVKNVTVDAQIYLHKGTSTMVGAIAGYSSNAIIDSCEVKGNIESTVDKGNNFVAGVVGFLYKGAVINTSSAANVKSVAQGSVAETGGITALNNRALIAQCYTTGDVYASADRDEEGMAAPGGLVGVQAGSLVNSVAYGNVSAGEYSFYTGMLCGWVTGIGKVYQCYYNKEAKMKIGDQVPDPVVDIGTAVGAGINDEGEKYKGCYIDMIGGLAASEMKSAAFANQLNANNAKLGADITTWGLGADALRKYVYNHAAETVTLSDEKITSVYVQPSVETEEEEVKTAWKDGTFYGRSTDKSVTVAITVADSKLTDIRVISGTVENEATLKAAILKDQKVTGESAYETAVKTALDKMEAGDTSDYASYDSSKFAGGDGTKENPYQIANEEQLRYLAASLNADNSYAGVYFKQTKSITLTKEWKPIGSAEYPFEGNFDGGNYSIYNLTIGSSENPANYVLCGLFGYCNGNDVDDNGNGTTIENVQLKDIAIYNNGATKTYVAGLAGGTEYGVKIKNCNVTGKIYAVSKDGYCFAGGLIGQVFRGLITNCHTDVNIEAVSKKSWADVGGLISSTNRATVINCYAEGNVNATAASANKASAGGLMGMNGGVVINCVATGDVVSTLATQDVGGLCGRHTGIAAMYNSYYNAEALQKNGNTIAEENQACGVSVAGSKTENVLAKTKAQMATDAFASELNTNNENIADTIQDLEKFLDTLSLVHHQYYDNSALKAWYIDNGTLLLRDVMSGKEQEEQPVVPGRNDSGTTSGGQTGNNTPSDDDKNTTDNKPDAEKPDDSKKTDDAVAKGDVIEKKDASYKVTSAGKNKTVSYVESNKNTKKVTIPSKVVIDGKTYKVTAISAKAFANNKNLKTIVIPSTVKKIGKNAFKGINKNAVIYLKGMTKKQVKALKNQIKNSGIAKTVKIKTK